jgi:CubicO group peptidase (beta-lactamase class C family)
MRLLSIRIVLLLVDALLSSVIVTRAQGVIEPDRAPHAVPAPRHPALPDFSMQQRAAIYRSVIASMKEHRMAPLPFDTQVELGTILSEAAELYPLPENIRTQIAAANKYKYTVWHGQVLLVDPAKKTVVDILHDYILRDYDKQK